MGGLEEIVTGNREIFLRWCRSFDGLRSPARGRLAVGIFPSYGSKEFGKVRFKPFPWMQKMKGEKNEGRKRESIAKSTGESDNRVGWW